MRAPRVATLSRLISFLVCLSAPLVARAAATLPVEAHPEPPASAIWAGAVVIGIVGLFVMAAVIGPIVRMELPREVPPAHAHDEPPGTSGHHGRTGLMNPDTPRDVRDIERG